MSAHEVIRKHIIDNGIKQRYVADRIGISPELFRRSLEGKRKIPADEFIGICTVLSLDINDFKETKSA